MDAKTDLGQSLRKEHTAVNEVMFRGGGFVATSKPLYSWAAFLAIIVIWQAVTGAGLVHPIFLPSPYSIVLSLWSLIVSGELWLNLKASLIRVGLGWSLGTVFGIGVGLSIGLFSASRAIGIPMVSAIYPVPKIALLPLLILWLGIGEEAKIFTILLGTFFPTVIATITGVDNVPRNLIRMAQSFNIPMWAIIWKVVLPSSLPTIFAGFRISLAVSLILLVSAEMIGAPYGIGSLLLTAGNLMQSDKLLAGVVVLSALGLGFSGVVTMLERTALRWR